jgi:hypothetical protein
MGIDEDDETPEAHAAAFEIAKMVRLYNSANTEKPKGRRRR